MDRHKGKLVYVGSNNTHGWGLAIEGSIAHRDPCEESKEAAIISLKQLDGDESVHSGGVVGCSEWLWLTEEDAERLVNCWNACEGIENPSVMRKEYDQLVKRRQDSV